MTVQSLTLRFTKRVLLPFAGATTGMSNKSFHHSSARNRRIFPSFFFLGLCSAFLIQATPRNRTKGDVLFSYAAQQMLTGVVTDNDGAPLIGASVVVKGTFIGAITDAAGKYVLEASGGETVLSFSYVGYTTQEIVVGSRSVIDVAMVPDTRSLEEVVVVGYGTQSRRDISGAVTSLKAREMENLPMPSFDRVMQGRMAGVRVSTNTGVPGGGVEVRIRGVGSIGAGNEPLYIIDGVQVNNGSNASATIVSSSNALSALNPNDILSIDVLKDGAAAAIYGAMAANGVVIITTKRGKEGPTELNFNTYLGYSEHLKKLDLLSGPEFTMLYLEAVANRYGADSQKYTETLATIGNPEDAQTYDWQDALYRRGFIQNYELSATGGSGNTRFYISGAYNNVEGQVIGSDFDRGTLRVNLSHQAGKKFSFENSLNLSTFTQNAVPSGRSYGNPNLAAVLTAPVNAIYNDDGSYNEVFRGLLNNNLVQTNALNTNKATNNQLIGNIALNYKITSSLTFRSSFGIDYSDVNETQYFSPKSKDGQATSGYMRRRDASIINWQTDQTLTYQKVFNDVHDVNVVAGVGYRNEVRDAFDAATKDFPNEFIEHLAGGATAAVVPSGSYTAWKLASGFGRAHYTLWDKYIATVTLRYDGSSRFGANKKWGLFPSASLAWRLSQEEFLLSFTQLDELKVRMSYGVTGNALIGDFNARNLYVAAGDYGGKKGISPGVLENADLTWEQNNTLNFGLDYGFFGGRVSGSVDYFIRRSERLLLGRPLPQTSGYGSIMDNVGNVENRGLEFEVSTVNLESQGFKWTSAFNISFTKNKVTKLLEGQDQLLSTVGPTTTIIKVGEPLGSYYSYRYAGVNVADGRAMWYDKNGNITYLLQNADRAIVGSTIPDYFGGLTNTFSYRGLYLTVFFQYQFGNEMVNGNAGYLSRSGSNGDFNQYQSQMSRWQKPGDVTRVPRPWEGGTILLPGYSSSSMYTFSDRFVEDASYIRLKQIMLGYNIPSGILQKIRLRKAQLYLQAINLLTFTEYTGFDPELVNGEGDYGVYPQAKNYTVGVQLGL